MIAPPPVLEGDEMSVEAEIETFRQWDEKLQIAIREQILGQDAAIEASLCTLLAGGHLLLVGVPGTGKTRLAECLSQGLGLPKGRIQFTPDLLPADILGAETLISGPQGDRVEFRKGPIFHPLIVADEINRGTPRTQSALLEAMQEGQVTLAGERYPLDPNFSVIATRNPIEMEGTYPLPEAQRDRFMMEVLLPPPEASVLGRIARLTTGSSETEILSGFESNTFEELRATVRKVIAADAIVDRAARWVAASRPEDPTAPPSIRECLRLGGGARALQALILCGKVEALRSGRSHLADSDWQKWREPILRHRIVYSLEGELRGWNSTDVVAALDEAVS